MEPSLSLGELTAEHFLPLVGRGFRVRYPEHAETLILERVEPRGGAPFGRAAFALFFRGESTEVLLNQHVHPLEQESLGRLDLFLVPIGREPDGTHRYQAVFS